MTLHIQAQTALPDGRTACVVKDNTDADFDAYLTREQADQVVNKHGPEVREKAKALEAENGDGWRATVDQAFADEAAKTTNLDAGDKGQAAEEGATRT